ncbi:peptidase C39-like protein [Actinomycetospora succinea]|uniref:Peptidase C39-like protein n=1 Tax=Actinomycetospora succinea TaxID=663603 RepID=A0A4R6UTA4_9PSEU|nr:C39 family peptidase [Actinomycetospora succinea]TDQ48933.1 peptidase C39-like protein [Actinomycetospora succinea]
MEFAGAEDLDLFTDLDGDGTVDVTAVDTDGDGLIDLAWTDANGDGAVTDDEVHPVTDGGWSTDWFRHEELRDGALPSEASAARDDDIHGDPEQASSYWYAQSVNGYCVPAAVAQIVGEWQGQNVGEPEVVSRAVAHGWLTTTDTDGDGVPDDASGMTSQDAEALLESYGIPATTTHGSLKDLESLLDADRDIIAYVDSDEVWYGADDDGSDGGSDANHAVVVTGIDDENVYLADPGDPNGAISVVPRATFEDAWEDSGHEMLVTDTAPPHSEPASNAPTHAIPPDGGAQAAGAPPADASAGKPGAMLISTGSTGVVLLPIVLRDVAVASAGVSALLVAAGVVRSRAVRGSR